MSAFDVPEVAVSELSDAAHSDRILLDVREIEEWDAGHVEGSVHVPMSGLPGDLGLIPKSPLAVFCRSGARSAQVTGWLRAQGYDAVNVAGGAHAWVVAGQPLTAAGGGPGSVA